MPKKNMENALDFKWLHMIVQHWAGIRTIYRRALIKQYGEDTMNRPGVMIYFSLRPALKYLKDEQLGQLLRAILDYAECGEIPDFLDPLLAMAWSFVVSGIDRDWEAYQAKVEKRKYAAYCRDVLKSQNAKPSYEQWQAMSEEERASYLQSVEPVDII